MNNPLVSVIIPVYNVEEYIEEAVNSIINQSYENLEIIIVDDCSSDNTFSILQKISKLDGRIRLYRNEENLQIVKTLNKALAYAEGEYIARMDGDDISMYDRIEKQVRYLEENKNIDLVGTSVNTIDDQNKIISKKFLSSGIIIKNSLNYTQPICHPTWLTRRFIYENLNGYREVSGVEDYDFLLRMDSLGYEYDNIAEFIGLKFRIRQGNSIDLLGAKQRLLFSLLKRIYKDGNILDNSKLSYKVLNQIEEKAQKAKLSYAKSSYFLRQSIMEKSRSILNPKWIIFLLLAILYSSIQREYLFNKLKYRLS